MNIWISSNRFYSYNPVSASYYPYYDGVVTYPTINASRLSHYVAKYLNLISPCGSFCSDNDGIADTPPCTVDTIFYCYNVSDTISACGTSNTQNIMINVDTCAIMFTYGQAQYMQYILQINIGNRDSLVSPANYIATGMDQPSPDMLPKADFSVKIGLNPNYFFYPGQMVQFADHSWNDTITGVSWTFSNNATIPASAASSLVNKFGQPGWVSVSLAATGNNTGTTTITDTAALFIADTAPTNGYYYYEEFEPGGDMGKWPMFNYFHNNFKWQKVSLGCYDNDCIGYSGFDTRSFPEKYTGTPSGDYDDLYSPVFDITGFSGPCYLNFMSSGAMTTSNARWMHDTLEIAYATGTSNFWKVLARLTGDSLANKGTVLSPYAPAGINDWVPQSVKLPAAAMSRQVTFRFRYHPGADSLGYSSGNNFYLDHFNLNSVPEMTGITTPLSTGISVVPNPAHGNCTLLIKNNGAYPEASIMISDISGRIMWKANRYLNGTLDRIDIPDFILKNPGMYLVRVITGEMNETTRLVIY